MQPNKNLNKTAKYSNVVKNIKNTQEKPQQEEEPRITAEQVIAAFHAFGFEPNERNHNDIAYWTTKGQSEGVKLIDELHKRRVDINNEEDEKIKTEKQKKKEEEDRLNQHKELKSTLPRLSDEDINALFDEYGLPAPDPEWARNHLPNDPKKIRSILEVQRKMTDDLIKKESKNKVNALPEIPKGGQPQQIAQGGVYNGQGGPVDMQGQMTDDGSPTTPFFIGDHSLVKIINKNNPNISTVWLVDSKKKVLRPFKSQAAFRNAFEDPDEAEKAIVTITTKELGPGGALEGFKPLAGDKGIKEDGSMDDIEFSEAELQQRYGQPEDPASEDKALSMLDGIFGNISNNK